MNLNDWDGAPDWDSLIYGDFKNYRTSYRDTNYAPFNIGSDGLVSAVQTATRPSTTVSTTTTTIPTISTPVLPTLSGQTATRPSTTISSTSQGSVIPSKIPSTTLLAQVGGTYTAPTKGLTQDVVRAKIAAARAAEAAQLASQAANQAARLAAPIITSGGGGGGGSQEEAPAEAPAPEPVEAKKKTFPIVPIAVIGIVAYVLSKS